MINEWFSWHNMHKVCFNENLTSDDEKSTIKYDILSILMFLSIKIRDFSSHVDFNLQVREVYQVLFPFKLISFRSSDNGCNSIYILHFLQSRLSAVSNPASFSHVLQF